MPLKFNQTKCNAVKFNNTTLSVIKYNGNNVFKSGNVKFTYTLTSQNENLNQYASNFYARIKNVRTGETKTVGGSIGTTSVSISALDGDKIRLEAFGYYEGGSLRAVSPLQNGTDEDGTYFNYPLNDADIQFTAALNMRGYYDPDRRIWVLNEAITGTITANYYVNILDDYE
jgi:hypothetical protein